MTSFSSELHSQPRTRSIGCAGEDVRFSPRLGTARVACCVASEVRADVDLATDEPFDHRAASWRHAEHVDAVANGLVWRGLRGAQLAVRAQHFMD